MSDPYVYPGFRPFADRAADEHKIPDAERHRVSAGPFVRDIESGLSQLPMQADRERRKLYPEGTTRDAIGRIRATRDVLAAQLAAVDEAIEEVLGAVAPPRTVLLKDEPKPKPKRNRRPRARPEPAPPVEEEAESEAQEQEEEASEDDQEPDGEREDDESAD